MESIIETFHLDWKLFLAQVVNFAIVVSVLWYFAFRPLVKNLTKRTKIIEKSLKDARDIEEQHRKILELKERAINEAKIDAKKIMDLAAEKAKNFEEEMKMKMKDEARKILEKTKGDIEGEKKKMINEVRQEAAGLVVLALEKVLQEKVSPELDQKIAEKAVNGLVGRSSRN